MPRKLTKIEMEALQLRLEQKADQILAKHKKSQFANFVENYDWSNKDKYRIAKEFLLLGMMEGLLVFDTFRDEIRASEIQKA